MVKLVCVLDEVTEKCSVACGARSFVRLSLNSLSLLNLHTQIEGRPGCRWCELFRCFVLNPGESDHRSERLSRVCWQDAWLFMTVVDVLCRNVEYSFCIAVEKTSFVKKQNYNQSKFKSVS